MVALNPVAGDQLYVLAPLAVSDWLPPYMMEGDAGVTATVGCTLFVNTTSSEDVQVPLVMVQRSVALLPAVIPETADVAEVALAIVAVPLTILHVPVPVVGDLPASVNDPLLQFA